MNTFLRITSLMLVVLLFAACGKGNTSNNNLDNNPGNILKDQKETRTFNNIVVYGRVLEHQSDRFGSLPVPIAQVSVGNVSVETDTLGFYEIQLDEAQEPVVISFSKNGFASTQYLLDVADNQKYIQNAGLSRFQKVEVRKFDAEEVIQAGPDINAPNLRLTVPEGAVSTNQDVAVQVLTADPTTDFGRQVFPGEYTAATSPDSDADTMVESIAFADVTLRTLSGDKITTLAAPARLELKLPDIYQTGGSQENAFVDDPDDLERGWIEWWSFNEKTATWIQEDANTATPAMDKARVFADQNGVLYAAGDITHFSWWNVDKPVSQHACLCVNVENHEGNPYQGANVRARGVSYNGTSTAAISNAAGQACVTVKRSISVTETVSLFANAGGVNFVYTPTTEEAGPGPNTVKTPGFFGSTYPTRAGSCQTLTNPLTVDMSGTITGQVIDERNSAPLANYPVYTDYGQTTTTDENGNYTLSAPISKTVTIWVPGGASERTRTIFSSNGTATANFVVLNRSPGLVNIIRSLSGAVPNGVSMDLTAVFNDVDGETLSYAWELLPGSAGVLTNATNDVVTYTAPATGSGTDRLRLTVSDGFSADYTTILNIAWGEAPGADVLNITVLNIRNRAFPIEGVTVVLHAADNYSIEDVGTTDATGVVSFNTIGRTRVSYTIINKEDNSSNYSMMSFMDVLVADDITHLMWDDYVNSPTESSVYAGFSVTEIPAAMDSMSGSPIGLGSGLTYYGVTQRTFPSGTFTGNQIQDDGNVSILFWMNDYVTGLLSYGFTHDVTPVAQGQTVPVYPVVANRAFESLPWTSNQASTFASSPMYIRKGVRFGVPSSSTGSSGSYQFASAFAPEAMEFPASVSIFPDNSTMRHDYSMKQWIDTSVSMPASVQHNFTDLVIPQINYNIVDGSANWSILGSQDSDVTRLDWDLADYNNNLYVNWRVFTDSNVTSWRFPLLPPGLDVVDPARVAIDNESGLDSRLNLVTKDYVSLGSMDDVWPSLRTGSELDEIAPETTHQRIRVRESFGYTGGGEG